MRRKLHSFFFFPIHNNMSAVVTDLSRLAVLHKFTVQYTRYIPIRIPIIVNLSLMCVRPYVLCTSRNIVRTYTTYVLVVVGMCYAVFYRAELHAHTSIIAVCT